jgi:hypothetical protein
MKNNACSAAIHSSTTQRQEMIEQYFKYLKIIAHYIFLSLGNITNPRISTFSP